MKNRWNSAKRRKAHAAKVARPRDTALPEGASAMYARAMVAGAFEGAGGGGGGGAGAAAMAVAAAGGGGGDGLATAAGGGGTRGRRKRDGGAAHDDVVAVPNAATAAQIGTA